MAVAAQIQEKPRLLYTENTLLRLSGFLLNQVIRDSTLTVICADSGQTITCGPPGMPPLAIRVADAETLWHIVSNPDPGAGELYMDGKWEVTQGDLGAFITMMARNLQALLKTPASFLLSAVLRKKLTPRKRDIVHSKNYVSHHYDIGNDLYEVFLDEGMNYSCAFFDQPARTMSLRDAQLNKIHTTFRRLGIMPGMRVLDIGCGWGEACRIASQETGAARVTGITLAENQLAVARKRAGGMLNPPAYLLEDYRDHAAAHPGAYDRIFSIGMFEHVGEDNYRDYFAAIRRLLAPGGRALVHSIMNASMATGQSLNSPWLEKYIFPGGRLPDLPEMIAAASAEGLRLAFAPYLQPPSDYAETLRRWRGNFLGNAGRLDLQKYDERFRRMWTYYFALCEAMFDGCGFQVGQIVFEKDD